MQRLSAVRQRLRALRGARYRLHPRWESLDQLVVGMAHDDGLLRIDLGSGFYKPEGFVGLDDLSGGEAQVIDNSNAPDVYMDLNNDPLPFADHSCDEVRSSHFLEHSNLDHIFDEAHRVLRPLGVFQFAVPYANSAEGMFPGHLIFLTETFFEQNLHFQRLFRIDEVRYQPSPTWDELPSEVRELLPFDIARKVLFNVCNQMTIVAIAREDV